MTREQLCARCNDDYCVCDAFYELRAEVERLKVLLQEAVSDPRRNVLGDDWWRRAKAALEDKP